MKTAVVLGSSGVLGKAICQKLIEESYLIIGTHYTKEASAKQNIEVIALDWQDEKSVQSCIEKISKHKISFFTCTIANPPEFKKFEDISIERFQSDWQNNVLTQIRIIKKLLPSFEPNANIVFILSEETVHPTKYLSSYTVSKFALLGLMRVLANELQSKKIRVNAVSPGMMDTPFIRSFPSPMKELYKNSHKGKLADPDHVAQAIMKIIKDEKINGQNIEAFDD